MSHSIQYDHWRQLDHWLTKLREFWHTVPFVEARPGWTIHQPALADWLLSLSEAGCEALEKNPRELVAHLRGWLPEFDDYWSLLELAETNSPACPLPEVRARDMPGRKRLQAGAFAGQLAPVDQRVLDWCCGKGHLSRTLAAAGAGYVVGYEWQAALVADGNRLAQLYGDPVHLECQDVMAEPLLWPEPPPDQLVALHACGDLHRQLLRQGVHHGVSRISMSPCCYHLTGAAAHQPLSARVQQAGNRVVLNREQMRLAVRETVTASQGVQARTRLRSAWRLGFDEMQRTLRKVDEYLAVPSEPAHLLQEGFPEFCQWAAQNRGIELPEDPDYETWEARGWVRYREVRRFELIRHLFRRPLELWMILDYALFLEESGYQVRLSEFCERQLTPRNLLLDAVSHEKRRRG